jgi:Na+/H+ antiporter NhaD/arsenite permease-like protein
VVPYSYAPHSQMALTPVVLDLVTRMRRNPVPYLLAIAMASNIGSTATITGNPQNMIIGSLSHITYRTFAAALSPIAGIGLVLTVGLIALVYRSEFGTCQRLRGEFEPAHADWPIIVKSAAVSLAMIVAFFAGIPPAEVAIVAGAILLLTRRIKSEKVYAEIEWTLLLMFARSERDHRNTLEYRQQCPGSARAEAIHRAIATPAAGLAHCCNGLDPRR